jgi:hypothetical protein
MLRSVQSQGAFECVEFIVHSQRGRREHRRVRALEQRLVHRFAHVDQQRFQLFRDAIFLATQSGRIGIRFRSPVQDDVGGVHLVFELHRGRCYLALDLCRAFELFQISHELLTHVHQLLRCFGHRSTIAFYLGKRCAGTHI